MENTNAHRSPFNKLVEEKQVEGWDYVGTDQLLETKFIDGRFIEVPVRTEDEVRKRQRERLQALAQRSGFQIDIEIDLISKPGIMFDGVEIPDKYQSLYVFAKVVK